MLFSFKVGRDTALDALEDLACVGCGFLLAIDQRSTEGVEDRVDGDSEVGMPE